MQMDSLLWVWLVPGMFVLLHLTALVLALVFYRRCPSACGLVVISSMMSLSVTIARAAFQFLWLHNPENRMAFGLVMSGFAGVSWIAYGLLIVAVFVGRTPPTPTPYRSAQTLDDDDDEWNPPAAAPAAQAPDSAGFRHRDPSRP